jgi:asparagine synthase (glutamine-hydrolysing)
MLRRLQHRGPDGEGILERQPRAGCSVVLGHRRLSIIDPSASASQPMTSADGARHLVFNGEIYNYVELRSELEALGRVFRSRSDTEVLLEGWCAWGPNVLDRAVGMFAFALLDETRGTLLLARDQFSMKPLYYVRTSAGFAFASEIPPLLDSPGVRRHADADAVADYVERGTNNHVGRTMFADVHELPGAHLAELGLDPPFALCLSCYWRPPRMLHHDLPFRAAADAIRARLEESVRMHLRSDVKVGALLSGGVDSSAVVVLMRRALGAHAELHTFSYRGEDGATDEGPYQDVVRSTAGTIAHEVRLRPEEWVADIGRLVASQGEPFGSLAIYGQRRLFQLAAEHGVRVVLDGQGADEYLAGYSDFRGSRIASLLRQRRWVDAARLARRYVAAGARLRELSLVAAGYAWPTLRGVRRRLGVARRPDLLDPRWLVARGASFSPPWNPVGYEVLREALGRRLSVPSIPWLMRYADRNAMAFSVENRLPFLTPPLVEFALGLPEEHFIDDRGVTKHVLREAMRGLVPDQILDRRDKVGFDVPLESWLTRMPNADDLLRESARIPAVRAAAVAPLVRAVRARARMSRREAFRAWRLITLAAWRREFDVRLD